MSKMIDITLGVVSVCALAVTGLLVKRQFFPSVGPDRPAAIAEIPPELRSRVSTLAIPIGAPSARTDLVEFTDLQCPYCAAAHDTLLALIKRHPGQLNVRVMHTPLRAIHPMAYEAAIAANCAAQQGRFVEFVTGAYAGREHMSPLSLDSLAIKSGVTDRLAFAACRAGSVARARVDSSIAVADLLGIGGTPTFYLNDTLVALGTPPGMVARSVERSIAGQR